MPTEKLSSLQILRALAAVSVVHLHTDHQPRFGSFGVDIFFVLSGFVIAVVVERGESPRAFVGNRISRIVPLYWLMTAGVFVVGSIAPSLLGAATANGEQLIKSLLFIPFFRANGDMAPLLGVGWSLNYEMFFYGCVLVAILWFRRHWMLAASALIAAAYLGLGVLLANRVTNWFFGAQMIFEFALGLVAFQIWRRGWLRRFPAPACAAAAACAYAWMVVAEVHRLPVPTVWSYRIPAFVVVLGAVGAEPLRGPLLDRVKPHLVKIGDASYATYLSHYYVIAGFERVIFPRFGVIDPNTVSGMLLVVAFALAVGQLLHSWVDRPLHSVFKRRLRFAIEPLVPRTA